MARLSGPHAAKVWFHRTSAIIWLALIFPAYIWWRESVAFVIAASIYANVKSDWGAAEAADDREVLARLDRIEALLPGVTVATVHVVPVGDLVAHDTDGDDCLCGPSTEAVYRDDGTNGWLIRHNSLDGREAEERDTGHGTGKVWRFGPEDRDE